MSVYVLHSPHGAQEYTSATMFTAQLFHYLEQGVEVRAHLKRVSAPKEFDYASIVAAQKDLAHLDPCICTRHPSGAVLDYDCGRSGTTCDECGVLVPAELVNSSHDRSCSLHKED